jgi:hypothetical protein
LFLGNHDPKHCCTHAMIGEDVLQPRAKVMHAANPETAKASVA